jgi:hypothetical protein
MLATSARADDEVAIAPRVERGLKLGEHFGNRHHPLAG